MQRGLKSRKQVSVRGGAPTKPSATTIKLESLRLIHELRTQPQKVQNPPGAIANASTTSQYDLPQQPDSFLGSTVVDTRRCDS